MCNAPYAAKFTAFKTKLAAAQAPETRGSAATLAKRLATIALLDMTRQLARTIGNNMMITDTQRQQLGLTIRKVKPTPVPPPATRPALAVQGVDGRTVTLSIRNADGTKKAKPAGAIYANVYTYVGPSGAPSPTDPTQWLFDGPATKNVCTITVADSVAAGSQLWVTAVWVSRRGKMSPIAVPVTTHVQYGPASPVNKTQNTPTDTQGVKIAA